MKIKHKIICLLLLSMNIIFSSAVAIAQDVSLEALGRFDGWRDNPLVGYGIVVGLSGSGDSPRNSVTQQSLQNAYGRLGITVDVNHINSRNVAAVFVMATLPASANVGDRISLTASSTGDARSLSGGTLLMTPLSGPDGQTYALAQGPLIVGGYRFDSEANVRQRNYPTTGRVENGASVEKAVNSRILKSDGTLSFLLNDPNFTTASRISAAINGKFGPGHATVINADEVQIDFKKQSGGLAKFISDIQSLKIQPEIMPRIVINERTGTIVAGGNVIISDVVISQGDIEVIVNAENFASQPSLIAGRNGNISSLVIRNTDLRVEQGGADIVAGFENSTVSDLFSGLHQMGVDTRRVIAIIQAMKRAGAIHAEIIII